MMVGLRSILFIFFGLIWGSSACADYVEAKKFYDNQNYTDAFNEVISSAEAGDPNSLNLLGILYLNGLGVDENVDAAVEYFEKAIEKKSFKAYLNLASIYKSNKWGRLDNKKAEILLLRAIESSEKEVSAQAAFDLGLLYYFEPSLQINELKALDYLRRAAKQDHVLAMLALGHLSKSESEQFLWYEKASNFNDPEAQFLVGSMLFEGRGTEKNLSRAFELLEKSVEKNYSEASLYLGRVYGFWGYGEGSFNYETSINYFRKAINQGSLEAVIDLATLLRTLARYEEAIELFKEAIQRLEKEENLFYLAHSFRGLAAVQFEYGQYDKAEINFLKALQLAKNIYSEKDKDLIDYYADIATFYAKLKLSKSGAEAYYLKALSIANEVSGYDDVSLKQNYATFLSDNDRTSEATNIYEDLLEKIDLDKPNDYRQVSAIYYNLARIYSRIDKIGQAEQYFQKAIEINNEIYGAAHDDTARIYRELAVLHRSNNDFEKAFINFEKAKGLMEKVYFNEHSELLNLIVEISKIEQLRDNEISELRNLLDFKNRLVQLRKFSNYKIVSTSSTSFEQSLKRLLDLTAKHSSGSYLADIFDTIQLLELSTNDKSLEYNFAMADPEKSNILSELQKARLEQKNQIIELKKQLPTEENLKKAISVQNNIDRMESEILSIFPRYTDLISPQPVNLIEIQGLIKPNEGLLAFFSDEVTGEIFSFLTTNKKATFYSVDAKLLEIENGIELIKQGINLNNVKDLEDFPNFDLHQSHFLYKKLLGPVTEQINELDHLIIVPPKSFYEFPFNLLVTKPPKNNFEKNFFEAYRNAAWLIKQHSITILPSVSSLRSLRLFNSNIKAEKPFVGFGDPVLNGKKGNFRGLNFIDLNKANNNFTDQLSSLPELPQASEELFQIASYLRATENEVYVRERASENVIKNKDLMKYNVVAFATHGLFSGELPGLDEPALVLTPPKLHSEENDGLLTASEVAKLNLNAELVLLSACNTMSSNLGNLKGLSGLARAFIYAGARSLLVSYWELESTAAAQLTSRMFKFSGNDEKLSRSKALQLSMISLINDEENSHFSHPALWAAFSLVGEDSSLN